MSKILIRGAKVLGGEPQDVLITDETITAVGTDLTVSSAEGAHRAGGASDVRIATPRVTRGGGDTATAHAPCQAPHPGPAEGPL